MKPTQLTTPQLLYQAANKLDADPELQEEVRLRAMRLDQLEYQSKPGRNDLDGQTPAQILATVNAPSP